MPCASSHSASSPETYEGPLSDSSRGRRFTLTCSSWLISIPAVVQDELIGNHKKDIQAGKEKLNLEVKALRKCGVKVDISSINVAAESERYAQHVESVKAAHGIDLSPTILTICEETFPVDLAWGEVCMKRKRYTEEQIIGILKEHEADGPTNELIRSRTMEPSQSQFCA